MLTALAIIIIDINCIIVIEQEKKMQMVLSNYFDHLGT